VNIFLARSTARAVAGVLKKDKIYCLMDQYKKDKNEYGNRMNLSWKARKEIERKSAIPQINTGVNQIKDTLLRTPTQKDNNVLLNKKTEKLTLALYLVSGLLSDKEPLKWKIRDKAIVLLDYAKGAIDEGENVSDREDSFMRVSHEIVALLEIASLSGMVSDMNYSVLKRECFHALDVFRSVRAYEKKHGGVLFLDNFFVADDSVTGEHDRPVSAVSFFDEPASVRGAPPRADAAKGSYKGHGKGQQSKGHIFPLGTIQGKMAPSQKEPPKNFVDRSPRQGHDRKDTILDMFKKNKGTEFTIRDISENVSGCSAKTIQRELAALVLAGTLIRTGDRRWSRYILK